MRRNYLQTVGAVTFGALANTAILTATSTTTRAAPATVSDPSPADSQIGGGQSYANPVPKTRADEIVDTKSALLTALNEASSDDVVWVANDAEIDLSGEMSIDTADGVTLASDRGQDGAAGGLLYTTTYSTEPIFQISSDNVRVSGLRFRGPETEYFDPGADEYNDYQSQGFMLLGDDPEIDNCQLYGWTVAPINVGGRDFPIAANIHHCSIHHNQMEGYGYGVFLYNGHSDITQTYFDYNRHSIAGFGYPTNGYHAEANLVGSHPVGNAFDMHGLDQNLDEARPVAGGEINIIDNTFQFTESYIYDSADGQEAIAIRGTPDEWANIENNRFEHPTRPDSENINEAGQAFRQRDVDDDDDWDNVFYSDNQYSIEET